MTRILMASVVSMFAVTAVNAQSPVGYDGWSANAGKIDTSATCGVNGVTCSPIAAADGFLYEMVKTPDYTYQRLIVTDPDADGAATALDFSSEVIIPFATNDTGIEQGIASRMALRDTAEGFEGITDIQRGSMRSLNAADAADMFTVDINQGITTGDMISGFKYTNYTQYPISFDQGTPDTDVVIGEKMDIRQEMIIGTGDAAATDKQMFAQSKRSGKQGTNSVTWPNGGGTFFSSPYNFVGENIVQPGSMTLGGTQVDYSAGDSITSTWVGQSINNSDSGESSVSLQTVKNETTAVEAGPVFSLGAGEVVTPFVWDEVNLGQAPSLP